MSGIRVIGLILDIAFAGVLVAIGVEDRRSMRIPNRLVLAILGVGLVRCLFQLVWSSQLFQPTPWILGMVVVSVPMLLLALAAPGSIGGGDIKLAGAAGLYLGPAGVVEGSVVGFLLAGVCGAILLLSKRKTLRDEFPLGPFLAAGYLGVLIKSYVVS